MNQELSDIDSYQRFYRQHFDAVVRYCTTLVDDQAVACDIVQEAFITLWQRRSTIDIHVSSQAYLYKTVYNISLNSLKQHSARKSRERKAGHLKIEMDAVAQASAKELENRIKSAIHKLPEGCRKVFELSREEGLKYKEIAAYLNISEKTVENQMGKALRLLRTALQDYLLINFIIMLLV